MSNYPEDFSNYPKSLTEIKAGNESDMDIWTPRDVLIDALRTYDSLSSDTNIDALIICYREKHSDGTTSTRFMQSGPDSHTTIGLIEIAKHRILNNDD